MILPEFQRAASNSCNLQRQETNSQETTVQSGGRVMVPPQGIHIIGSLSSSVAHACWVTPIMSDSATPGIGAHQAPLFMGFSRQEYYSGLPCAPPGDLPNSGEELLSLLTLNCIGDAFFTTSVTYRSSCCSVTKWCPILHHSMTGFPVPHHLLEFAQFHVHCIGDAIQPSHPLSPFSPAFNLSQHQGLFQWFSYSHQVAKALACRTRTCQNWRRMKHFSFQREGDNVITLRGIKIH